MDNISDRIMFLINELGYNKNAFSKAIGKGRVVIESIVGKRGSKPGAETLEGIMQTFPEISADWLLTGKGNPFKVDKRKVNIEEFRENFDTEYISKYYWNPDKDQSISKLEEEIKGLKILLDAKDKQIEEKERTNTALQKVVKMLEEYKEDNKNKKNENK